jgi:hypothetical protein
MQTKKDLRIGINLDPDETYFQFTTVSILSSKYARC